MRRFTSLFFIALLFFALLPVVFAATITVKQDGSGNYKTVQAALDAAKNGDVIVIGDNGKYVEDLTASPVLAALGIPSANLLSFTLKAGEGMKPVIQAANAESSQRMTGLGLPGRDMLGFVIWGCQNVVVQDLEIANLENSVNAFNVEASMVIADSNSVAIDNCTVRGPNAKSEHEGCAVLIAGVQANPFLVDNITVKNSLITQSHYGIISSVFQKGSGADPNAVTIENCQFVDGFESAVNINNAKNMTVRNCTIKNYQYGIHFAGGNSVVEDCIVLSCKDSGIYSEIDTNWNDTIGNVVVRRCAAVSCGMESDSAAGIRCTDGTAVFENCISAGNSGPGIEVRANKHVDVAVTVDHCDVYENFGLSEVMVMAEGDYNAKLTITNSNIVSTAGGVENQRDADAVTAHHNNVFVKGQAYYNATSANSVSKDPLYVSPTNDPAQFAFDGFKLQSTSPILKSAENGTAIGAFGSSATSIMDWKLF